MFSGARRRTREQSLLDPNYSLKTNHWSAAKPNLKLESGNACAWCGADTATVAHGDVEHIRPKSRWRFLAFCYDNYVFSCQVCNQVHKGDEFPLDAPMMATPTIAGKLAPDPLDSVAVQSYEEACLAELPRLIVPTMEDPERFFAYDADHVKQTVAMTAAPGAPSARVADTIRILGLNRSELLSRRYERYVELEPNLEAPLTQRKLVALDQMCRTGSPYAGMVRYFRALAGL